MSLPLSARVAVAAIAAALAAPAVAGGYAEPVAAPVVSAPVIVPGPAPAASADWTGFYVGGQLSYGNLSIEDADDEFDGVLYGVHAGYQRDFGRFVLGGEVDFDVTDISINDAADVDNIARLKLRAGYDAGRFMPYLTAGVARATLSAEGLDDDNHDGYFGGVGVAYALTDSIDVGAEVLRHRFDVDETDVDITTVGIRAAYRF